MNKHRIIKKVLSLLIVVALSISMLPAMAFAADGDVQDADNKTFTYVANADGIETGKQYLLVSNGYALTNASSGLAATKVTASNNTITLDANSADYGKMLWTAGTSNAYTTQGTYTFANNSAYIGRASSSNNATTLNEVTAYGVWSYDGNDLWQKNSSGQYTFYLTYSNGFTANVQQAGSAELKLYVLAEGGSSEEGGVADTAGTKLAFTSDVHNQSSTAAEGSSAARLDTWLDNVSGKISDKIDEMGFCGDTGYAGGTDTAFWENVAAVMNIVAENKNVKGNGFFVAGNHEYNPGNFTPTKNATTQKIKTIGTVDAKTDFVLYSLGSTQFNDNFLQDDITALENYLETAPTDKPIFILAHFPLHTFGYRTTANADKVIDVLNAAAAKDHTIIYLWGHNHSQSDTNYDKIITDKITYAGSSSKDIDFTYAAAGCMSDSENTASPASANVKGKGLVASLGDKKFTLTYYDASANVVGTAQTIEFESVENAAESGGEEPTGKVIEVTPTSSNSPTANLELAIDEDAIIRITNGSTREAYDFKAKADRDGVVELDKETINIAKSTEDTASTGDIKVTGKANGTIELEISNNAQYGARKATITIKVGTGENPAEPKADLEITPGTTTVTGNLEIAVGAEKVIRVKNGSSSNSYEYTATSGDTKIATVSPASAAIAAGKTADFTVTGVANGTITLTINASSRKSTITVKVGTGVEEETEPENFEKVKTLKAGKYVIVSEGKALTTEINDGYTRTSGSSTYKYSGLSGADVTVTGNKITSDVYENMVFTVEASGSKWVIKDAGGKILNSTYEGTVGKLLLDATSDTWEYASNQLKSTNSTKYLTWDTSESQHLFTVRTSGSDIAFYAVTDETQIKKTVAVTDVTLDNPTAKLNIDETVTLTATVKPDDATDKTVTWESDKPEVATVVNGKVTAIAEGTAVITAKAGEKTATCTVTVTDPRPKADLEITPGTTTVTGSLEIAVGAEKIIRVKNGSSSNSYEYDATSGDTKIATVSPASATIAAGKTADFTVTGVANGTITLTINASSRKSSITVKVGTGVEEETEPENFEKVSTLKAGKYVIVSEGKALTTEVNDGYTRTSGGSTYNYSGLSGADVEVTDKKITSDVYENMVFTVEASESKWIIKDYTGKILNSTYTTTSGTVGKLLLDTTNDTWEYASNTLTSTNSGKSIQWDTSDTSGNVYLFTVRTSGSDVAFYAVTDETQIKKTVAVTDVTLDNPTAKLNIDETVTLTATVKPDDATDKTVTWESDKPEVATVVNGKVTAIAEGTAVITAKAGEKTATCTVTVTDPRPKADLEITPGTTTVTGSLEIAVGAEKIIRVKNGSSSNSYEYDATSGDTEIATVSPASATIAAGKTADFTVTGVANGTITLTINASSRKSSITVKVGTGVEEETEPENFEKVKTLKAGKYVIVSEDKALTTEVNDGYTRSSSGTYSYSGLSGADVTVTGNKITSDVYENMVFTVEASDSKWIIKDSTGKILNSTYTTTNGTVGKLLLDTTNDTWEYASNTLTSTNSGKSIQWDTSDTSGNVYLFTVRSSGSDVAFYAVTDETQIKKTVAVTDVTLDNTTANLNIDETVTLTATVKPDDATDKTVTWESDKPEVATVVNGKVTAIAEGTAVITAKAGEKTATCTVTVTDPRPKADLEITPTTSNPTDSLTLEIDEDAIIRITNGSTREAYDFTVEVDRDGVVELDKETINIAAGKTGDLKVTGKADGAITLTIKNDNGDYSRVATITIKVGTGVNPADPELPEADLEITPTTSNPTDSLTLEIDEDAIIRITNGSTREAYDFTATVDRDGVVGLDKETINIAAGKTGDIKVTGKANGTITLTISNNNEYGDEYSRKATITIVVGTGENPEPPKADIEITPANDNPPTANLDLEIDEDAIIRVKNGSENNQTYTFTATVDKEGIVTLDQTSIANVKAGATCDFKVTGADDGTVVLTISNGNTSSERTATITIKVGNGGGEEPEHTHTFGQPTYTWTSDYSKCTATRICTAADCTETETETVAATVNTVNATCAAAGSKTYTATFNNKAFETQTETEVIEQLTHTFGKASYTWTEEDDGWVCTASRKCANCTKAETEIGKVAVKTIEPTCAAAGSTTYTATFTNAVFEEQTKVEAIEKLPHTFGKATYNWTELDGEWVCTASRTCEECTEIDSEIGTVVADVVTEATCTSAGQSELTATFKNKAFETQTKTVELAKLPHSFGEATYSWTIVDGKWACTASRKCANCPETETEKAVITETTVKATCTEDGTITYTATFNNEDFKTRTMDSTIPATGHNYVDGKCEYCGDVIFEVVNETESKAEYVFEKGTLTVDCDMACIVLVETEDGYEVLNGTEVDEDTYTYDCSEIGGNIIIAFVGDADLDGDVDMADATAVMLSWVNKEPLDDVANLAVNVDGDDEITMADASAIMLAWVNKTNFSWR